MSEVKTIYDAGKYPSDLALSTVGQAYSALGLIEGPSGVLVSPTIEAGTWDQETAVDLESIIASGNIGEFVGLVAFKASINPEDPHLNAGHAVQRRRGVHDMLVHLYNKRNYTGTQHIYSEVGWRPHSDTQKISMPVFRNDRDKTEFLDRYREGVVIVRQGLQIPVEGMVIEVPSFSMDVIDLMSKRGNDDFQADIEHLFWRKGQEVTAVALRLLGYDQGQIWSAFARIRDSKELPSDVSRHSPLEGTYRNRPDPVWYVCNNLQPLAQAQYIFNRNVHADIEHILHKVLVDTPELFMRDPRDSSRRQAMSQRYTEVAHDSVNALMSGYINIHLKSPLETYFQIAYDKGLKDPLRHQLVDQKGRFNSKALSQMSTTRIVSMWPIVESLEEIRDQYQ